MSSFAFSDIHRKFRVEAKNAIMANHSKRYYCAEQGCGARLHIVQGEVPYFAADRSTPHMLYCPYSAKSLFDPGKYDESKFSMKTVIEYLTGKNANKIVGDAGCRDYQDHAHSTTLPIRTLRVLYDMCKSKDIDDSYNSLPIRNVIFDTRCDIASLQHLDNFRVVECQSESLTHLDYNRKNLTITLFAPVNSEKRVPFVLNLVNYDMYKMVQNKLFKNKEHLYVVAGRWQPVSKENGFVTTINNVRQVIVIK